MAMKAVLFLLAFVLLVSTKVICTDEDVSTERHHHKHHHHHHKKAPGNSPIHDSVYPPKEAPAYPPPHHAPPPSNYPHAPPPEHRHRDHGKCVKLCEDFCHIHRPKRACEKQCVPCCDKWQCVPGPSNKCGDWDNYQVAYGETKVHCPKYIKP